MEYKIWLKQSRLENITYLAIWGILFITPLLSMHVRTVNNGYAMFDWTEIFFVWRRFSVFLLLFLIHNFLLAPLLFCKHKRTLYFTLVAIMVVAFAVYQHNSRPRIPSVPPHSLAKGETVAHRKTAHEPTHMPKHKPSHQGESMSPPAPPPIIGEHNILAALFLILILIFGANIGVKAYHHGRDERKRLVELEHKNLEQQMEYLKYQLNPHFLMNTLNNIHALIDIEPPKAQQAIIQLSKILRYVLYESNKKRVLMSQEVEFMQNYVQLMRMRYGDKLKITVISPDNGMGVNVPPLLFISFVENAFKHGVRYQEKSFITIEGKRYQDKGGEERLHWTCRNSKHRKQNDTSLPQQGGVGLANVRQRLSMIYNNNFTLDVNETDNTYEVVMDIPLDKVES